MSFSWKDYLTLAERLVNHPDSTVDEASFRTATSRAYYAAFGESKDYAVRKLGFVAKGWSKDHQLLRTAFEGAGMNDVAQSLGRLREWRNDCDYDSAAPVSAQYSTNAVAVAKKILQKLKN